MLKELNKTFITLIPKKKGAHNLNHFKPISLCNVCYKAILKIMVNRMKPLLNRMIDPTQVAFVPNRGTTKDVVLAVEKYD